MNDEIIQAEVTHLMKIFSFLIKTCPVCAASKNFEGVYEPNHCEILATQKRRKQKLTACSPIVQDRCERFLEAGQMFLDTVRQLLTEIFKENVNNE